MNKNRIYFYERPTPDGGTEILDYGPDSAWRVHRSFLKKRDYDYIGWSDGRFIKEAQKQIVPQKNELGIMKQATEEQRNILLEAREQEIKFARENEDKSGPPDMSRKEMIGGNIGEVQTPGMLGKMGGGR